MLMMPVAGFLLSKYDARGVDRGISGLLTLGLAMLFMAATNSASTWISEP